MARCCAPRSFGLPDPRIVAVVPEPVPFLAALTAAESELDRLADKLDVPIDGRSIPCVVVLGIARQAFVMYRGLRREAAAEPLGITGPTMLRSVVEAAILIRWIEDAPALRVDMYMAEDDRHRLAAAEPFRKFRARRATSVSGPVFTVTATAAMTANVADARARALAASEPIRKSGSVTPTVEAMALSTGDSAMWEAYEVIYRVSSPWTHLSGGSLAHHRVESRPDGSHLVVDGGYKDPALRAMAAPSIAHLLGSTSRICGLGIEVEARTWQDAIVFWPAPLVESMRP